MSAAEYIVKRDPSYSFLYLGEAGLSLFPWRETQKEAMRFATKDEADAEVARRWCPARVVRLKKKAS